MNSRYTERTFSGFCLTSGIRLLVGTLLLLLSSPLMAQPNPPGDPTLDDPHAAVLLRATPGEPHPSWDTPRNPLFAGPKPGVTTPDTDAPFSANTNTTLDVWSGGEEPGDYPAYWHNGVTVQSPRIAPPQLSLYRNLVASDPVSLGSFGPGQFCVWDTKLLVIGDDTTNPQYITNAVLLDGGLSRQLLFEKDATLYSGYGDGSTGEQGIEVETREYLRLVPAASNTMAAGDPRNAEFDHPFFTNVAGNAGWVELHKFNGGKLHFEMIPDGNVLHGRLRQIEDRFGTIIQVTYQVAASQINSSNIDDMWKIFQIHDRFGPAYEFDYGTQQHAGRWCVESIDVLNQHGGIVQYSYGSTTDMDPLNDGKLVGVTYADGNVATYSYGTDSGNTTIAWNDPASIGTFGRKIRVHVSGSSQSQSGNLGNQPTGVLVKVTTQDAPIETRLKVTPLVWPEVLIEYGGTVMKLSPGGMKRYATQAVDPCNYLEPVYAFNTYSNNADLLQGRFLQVVDERGQVYHYEFDALGFPVKKTYDKDTAFETFEEWTYGAYYNVTRYRDREGRVTKYLYNGRGRLLEAQVGILDVNGTDVNQPEYAVYRNEYFPAGDINRFMLKTSFTPLHVAGEADVHRTDFVYDQYNRLTEVIGSAEQTGMPRPVTRGTHDLLDGQGRRRVSMEDPEGRKTYTSFDVANRGVERVHPDGSYNTVSYGVPGVGPSHAAQKVVTTRDRTGTTDNYTYDQEGRLYVRTNASNATSLEGKFITSFTYYPDSALLKNVIRDSRTTRFEYDYRARGAVTKVFPNASTTLTTTRVYVENRLHYIEDPYGRRRYVAYNENGNRNKVRMLQYNRPYDQTTPPADRAAVLALGRVTFPNPSYSITDFQLDHSNNLLRVTDGRDTPTVYTYDSRNRQVSTIRGAGLTGFHFTSQTSYNADDTVSSIRLPRYYDSNDANAYQIAEQTFEYNGRSLLSKKLVAQDAANIAETEVFYHLDDRVKKHIDARDFEWITDWDNDDARFAGRKNPLNNGKFFNHDPEGRVTHASIVAQYDTHTNTHDPDDATTRREVTARYDRLGRPTARTIWLSAQGVVDPENPPIAGLDGISKSAGLTSQYVFDTRVFDGQGLDSAGGISVPRLGGGTWNVDIQACLAKLAEPVASGGAGVSFSSGRAGNARVLVNGEEEVSVEIEDAIGRRVMHAIIEGPGGNNPNSLVTWTCTVHDTVTNITGFGKTVEIKTVDSLGNCDSRLTDGSGNLLKTIDSAGQATVFEVDADGNRLSVRDPDGVGFDSEYDALGRMTKRTDTYGDVIQWTHDRSNNVVTTTDARNNQVTGEYNAGNQLVKKTDRLNGVSTFTYDLTGNRTSVTDAENRTTSYFNNAVGLNTTITMPDHVSGSTVNTAGYGKIVMGFNAASQLFSRTDQTGAVVEYQRDLAGRVLQRKYRSAATSPIVDTDTMTWDHANRLLTGTKGRYSNTVSRSYDIAGRLEDESLQIAGVTYTVNSEYDVRGQLSKLTYPDGSEVDRTYTSRGQLYEVSYEGQVYDTRAYDNSGRPDTITYRNGVVTTHTWRDDTSGKDNMLSGLAAVHPSGVTATSHKIGDLTMSYDSNKNILSSTFTGTMNPFGFKLSQFDANDRLTAWQREDDGQDQSWILSLENDWNSFTEEATTTARTHNAVHEILTVGSQTLLHDYKGNLTENSNNDTYDWDFDNQLNGADTNGGGNDVLFEYDVLGRRVAKVVTGQYDRIYVCRDSQVLMEYDRGSASTTGYRKYLYGSYVDEPTVMFRPWNGGWAPQYIHHDSNYNVIALTWPSGKVSERYAYDAYGSPTILTPAGAVRTVPHTDNPYLFTGRRWDRETGLYYFRARYFDPELGRFVGRDPSGYPDGLNAYAGYFVPGHLDPSGMDLTNVSPSNLEVWEDWFGSDNVDIDGTTISFSNPTAAAEHASQFFKDKKWHREQNVKFLSALWQAINSDEKIDYDTFNNDFKPTRPAPNVRKTGEFYHFHLGWQEFWEVDGKKVVTSKHDWKGAPSKPHVRVYDPINHGATGINISGGGGFTGPKFVGGNGEAGAQILRDNESGDIAVFGWGGLGPSIGSPGPSGNIDVGFVNVHDLYGLDNYSGPFLSGSGGFSSPWGGYIEKSGSPQAFGSLFGGSPPPPGLGAHAEGIGIRFGTPEIGVDGQFQYFTPPFYLYRNPNYVPRQGDFRLVPRDRAWMYER